MTTNEQIIATINETRALVAANADHDYDDMIESNIDTLARAIVETIKNDDLNADLMTFIATMIGY